LSADSEQANVIIPLAALKKTTEGNARFVPVGSAVESRKRKSFKIFEFDENGKSRLVGLISRENLTKLVSGEKRWAIIYRYENTPKADLDFSVKLALRDEFNQQSFPKNMQHKEVKV
jgi:hypothetical protein